jgi:phage terminase Nu1 subunit (DNA packaging protein)
VTEGHSYLRTTAADSTAGKVSDKTKDQTDMMKLMTDMQKRLSDLQRDVNQLKNEKFRPRKISNSTASRIASFKFWKRDCLMRILIS